MNCKLCGKVPLAVNNFGRMPIANYFVKSSKPDIFMYDLRTFFCQSCCLFQIGDHPEPTQMFNSSYPFFTGLSVRMQNHFLQTFRENFIPHKNENTFIVEIGSNDGTFLKNAAEAGLPHLGVEPSKNVANLASKKGVKTLNAFFDLKTSEKIKNTNGHATHMFAANVICHVVDLESLFKGIKNLLSPTGKFIFEEPYLLDMINKVSYDQIYDEHIYIFSILSISKICDKFDLELFDAEHLETHGGSMRYYIAHRNKFEKSERLLKLELNELNEGLNTHSRFLKFAQDCELRKNQLKNLIQELNSKGALVGGYAATSKSTTVLNYCGLDNRNIRFISDSTEQKIGCVTPGTNIPIISHEEMRELKPDYLILFAWNHEIEIIEKEKQSLISDVKWIKFVPEVSIASYTND